MKAQMNKQSTYPSQSTSNINMKAHQSTHPLLGRKQFVVLSTTVIFYVIAIKELKTIEIIKNSIFTCSVVKLPITRFTFSLEQVQQACIGRRTNLADRQNAAAMSVDTFILHHFGNHMIEGLSSLLRNFW